MSELYKALHSIPASAGAAPVVAHFHLYKALREEEQIALRALIRVFAMHNSTDKMTQRQQQHMLDNLCDAFDISPSVVESEQTIAAADPAVQAIRQLGDIQRLRTDHHDAFNDIDPVEWATSQTSTEDDGLTILTTTRKVPQHHSAKGGAKTSVAVSTTKGRNAEVKHAQAIFSEGHAQATSFAQLAEGYDRDAAHQKLLEMRTKVQEQLALLEAEQ